MGDKVYGFCGTNKCKREVVAMSYLLQYVDQITLNASSSGKYTGTLAFELPAGWHKTNTIVIGAMVIPDWEEGQRYHMWQPIEARDQIDDITINIYNGESTSDPTTLSVTFTDSAQLNPKIDILLLNTTELGIFGKITGGGTNPPLGD